MINKTYLPSNLCDSSESGDSSDSSDSSDSLDSSDSSDSSDYKKKFTKKLSVPNKLLVSQNTKKLHKK